MNLIFVAELVDGADVSTLSPTCLSWRFSYFNSCAETSTYMTYIHNVMCPYRERLCMNCKRNGWAVCLKQTGVSWYPCGFLRNLQVPLKSSRASWNCFFSIHSVDSWNPANQLIGSLSYLQGFIYPGWCRISAIKSLNSRHIAFHFPHFFFCGGVVFQKPIRSTWVGRNTTTTMMILMN